MPSRVGYACLDAYASVLVYVENEILNDPIRGPGPTILPPGTQMRLGCFVPHLSRPLFHRNEQHTRHIRITGDQTWHHPPNLGYFTVELQVRLQSNNHASCVGVGNVQGLETAAGYLLRWRPQSRQSGGQKGVVFKVSDDAVKPATYPAHK